MSKQSVNKRRNKDTNILIDIDNDMILSILEYVSGEDYFTNITFVNKYFNNFSKRSEMKIVFDYLLINNNNFDQRISLLGEINAKIIRFDYIDFDEKKWQIVRNIDHNKKILFTNCDMNNDFEITKNTQGLFIHSCDNVNMNKMVESIEIYSINQVYIVLDVRQFNYVYWFKVLKICREKDMSNYSINSPSKIFLPEIREFDLNLFIKSE